MTAPHDVDQPASGSSEGGLIRLRLDIAYDGTNFAGWASQRDQRTVQGELERVLTHVSQHQVHLTCAGRTDSGVHARGQVAHFDVPAMGELSAERIDRALPSDIRVLDCAQVSRDFDARFSAVWRRYSYTVCDDPRGPLPFSRAYQLDHSKVLDIDAMNSAAAALVGEHDFTSYCKLKVQGTTVREIYELFWERIVDPQTSITLAVMHVRADAFCHSMVRSLAGALIAVGDHRKPTDFPEEALNERSRDAGVTVMPAHPLVLEEVAYPSSAEFADRQRVTRSLRK